MKLRFTRQARKDIDSVYDYIAEDNPLAAQAVLDQIEAMIDRLPNHPELGRSGRIENTRELVIPGYPYLVAYEINGSFIDILAIIHTSRRWPESL